eukprot:jgi/Chrzof1/3639/Cz13g03120.t1
MVVRTHTCLFMVAIHMVMVMVTVTIQGATATEDSPVAYATYYTMHSSKEPNSATTTNMIAGSQGLAYPMQAPVTLQ